MPASRRKAGAVFGLFVVLAASASSHRHQAAFVSCRQRTNPETRRLANKRADLMAGLDADRASRRMSASASVTTTTTTDNNILMDGTGKINRELAERLWQWEQARHANGDGYKFPYSVRRGIRLVQEIITERHGNVADPDDLVQDGVIALMQAMASYADSNPSKDEKADKEEGAKRFETYARAYITRELQLSIESSRLVRSPRAADSPSSDSTGIAARSSPPPLRLISMENTVAVNDPESPRYQNLNLWDKRHDVVMQDGERVDPEEYLDQSVEFEGDDLMWVRQHQVAEPLKDHIISDEEVFDVGELNSGPLPSSAPLTDVIRRDVNAFLKNASLDDMQAAVVRLRFGFGDAPRSPRQVASVLGMDLSQVLILQEQALGKLRQTYADRYVEVLGQYYDEDYDEYQEDYFYEDSV